MLFFFSFFIYAFKNPGSTVYISFHVLESKPRGRSLLVSTHTHRMSAFGGSGGSGGLFGQQSGGGDNKTPTFSFGSSGNSLSGGGSGSGSGAGSGSGGFSFGNAGASKGSLFSSNSQPAGSAFGQTGQASTGGLFGQKPASTAQSNNANASAAPAPQPSGGGLFGTSSKPAGSLFGSNSTTQQSSNLFGSISGSQQSNNPSTSDSSKDTKPAGGLFGSTPSTGTSGGGLFGSSQSQGAQTGGQSKNAFGNTDNKTPSLGSGLFGSNTGSGSSTGLFGSTPQTESKPSDKAADKPAFSFGDANKTGTGSTPSFSFGQQKSDSKPAGGFSFGSTQNSNQNATQSGGSSLFGAPKPAENKQEDSTKSDAKLGTSGSSGFSFGASKPEDKPKETPAFSFGSKPGDASGQKTAESTGKDDKAPAAGSFSFGQKAADKPAFSFGGTDSKPAEKTSTSTPAFSFGQDKSSSEKPATSTAAEPKAADSGSFSFGKTEKKEDKPSVFGQKEQKPQASASTDAANSSTAAVDGKFEVSPSEYLKNRTFEDIVSKWTGALSKSVQRFNEQVDDVSKWDRILVENGTQIAEMYTEVTQAEQTQSRIDEILVYVGKQQDDVESMLDRFEKQTSAALPNISLEALQPVDQERREAYGLAETLGSKLDDLETSLGSVITEINRTSQDVQGIKDEDPVAQIIKILNAHLASLEFVDENATALQKKLAQIYQETSRVRF